MIEDRPTHLDTADGAAQALDPLVRWRREWESGVAAAGSPDGPDGGRLAARRRDYGSYGFVVLDLVLAVFLQFVLALPLLLAAVILFAATGHSTVVGGRENPLLVAWLTSPLFTLLGLFVADGAMLLVIWNRLARQKLSWAMVGLTTRARSALSSGWRGTDGRVGPGQAILFGLAIGVIALLVSSILGGLLQRFGLNQSGQDKLLIEPLKHAPLAIVLAMVFAGTFVAPTVEELFFRGYIFRAIAVRRGLPPAYVISAGAFALFHVVGGGLDLLPIVPVLFVIGLLLSYAYRRTGNLLSDITAHALNNGAAFALALLIHV